MGKRKQLLTPRGYLSWTQLDMWQRSPERYVQKYMLGADIDIRNSGLAYGKTVSEALESGDADGDGAMEALLSLLPHYDKPEHEIRVPLETPNGSVDLLGKLDTFNTKTFAFREYKTGRVPWTQKKAEGHRQLRHYAGLIFLETNKVPPQVHLDWAQTAEGENGVALTGEIKSFEVKIGMRDILEYLATASRAAMDIDARYREEMKKLT